MDIYASKVKRDIIFGRNPELSQKLSGITDFDPQIFSDIDSSKEHQVKKCAPAYKDNFLKEKATNSEII